MHTFTGNTNLTFMKEKLRCGVIGTGYLGQHHVRIYNELEHCELAGFYDSNPNQISKIQKQYPLIKAFTSIEELALECTVVSVAVPTDQHCKVALQLMDHSCHLLIEKPLCTDLLQAESILQKAKKNNLLIQVGHIEHYNPVMSYLERAVNSPKFISADRLAPYNTRGTEVGVVLDLMIHDIGIILQLVNSPIQSLDSVGVQVLSSSEDIANARLKFANGCIANINASRVSNKKTREIRVFQKELYLSMDFMNQTGHLLRKKGDQLERESIPVEKGEPLWLEISHFVDCIRSLSQPKVGVHFGKLALEIALQISDAINQKR